MDEIQNQKKIAELKQKITELENKSIEQSEFLSIVAHQLRAPLSGTKWVFKMLLDGDFGFFTPEHRDILEKGFKNNERMLLLLQEIIKANQNNIWEFEYRFEMVDIISYLNEVIANFLEESRIHRVRIVFKQPDNILPRISIDKNKFFLAIENLIENALKYNHPEGQIIIEVNEKNQTDEINKLSSPFLVLSIFNTGVSIPKEEQKNIFEKFYRASNIKKQIDGTGLGLFTAKKIITNHGGKIWFESIENIGTTFFISLPFPHNKLDL